MYDNSLAARASASDLAVCKECIQTSNVDWGVLNTVVVELDPGSLGRRIAGGCCHPRSHGALRHQAEADDHTAAGSLKNYRDYALTILREPLQGEDH